MNNKTAYFFSLILGIQSIVAFSQKANFQVHLTPISVPSLCGIQSFAFAQHNGKWLLIGGRLDGLHQRQPFASFDLAGHNNQLIVVDPVTRQTWSKSISSLSSALQDHVKSTNAEFFQEGNTLYLVGGYGYSSAASDHTTFANLTAIDVSATINAVINNTSITSFFRQISDSKLQVTGGRLEKIYDTYYLVGGQKFIGRYNPMGPTHGPGFIQEYTNEIRKFTISDNGTSLSINHLGEWRDTNQLHRRDYNVTPQIMPNGQEGLTAFSGVFQKNADIPFLNCVNIDSNGYVPNNTFSQYYNHYHCANIPLYSNYYSEMSTIFFGGIAQYYDNSGVLTQDNNVPFVNTIARVTRDVGGNMAEYKLPVTMPSLLGAGSEFIPVTSIPRYHNGVIKLDSLSTDTTLVGYIFGGISSTAPNIFFSNTGTQSSASNQLFEVRIIKGNTYSLPELNKQSTGTLKLVVFPNPNNGIFNIHYTLTQPSSIVIRILSSDGKIISERTVKNMPTGKHSFSEEIQEIRASGIYLVQLKTDYESTTQRIILSR